ncbi:MAG: hypothetical protein QG604_67 [Candidatus Dependentiae bacterium]|nr:hypothetical protein [Candidatus Dependentiae bacterium]
MLLLGLSAGLWYSLKMRGTTTNQAITVDVSTSAIIANDSEILVAQPLPTNVSMTLPKEAVQGRRIIHDGQVLLGTTIPKTGELGLLGRSLSDGLFLHLNKTKTMRFSLDQRDDSGQVYRAVPHIHDLLDKTPLFFASSGEIVFEKVYTPMLACNALALLFPVIGMRSHITEAMPIVWYRPPYTQEIAALLEYAIGTLKQNKIALFYEESTWGIEAKTAAEVMLQKKYNLAVCGASSYQPNTVTVQTAVADIKKSAPQIILCLSNGRPTYNFIREAINQQLHYASFLGLSRVANIAPQLQKSRGIALTTASVVPNPYNSQLLIVQEYRKSMQQYLPNKGLSGESLEGYIAASLLVYFLGQCPTTVTVGQLLTRICSPNELLFKGLRLQCKNKTLSRSVWINTGVDSVWHEYRGES